MHRSGSQDLGILNDNQYLEESGADLRNYRDQLQKDRNSRTLMMRASKHPSIGKLRLGKCSSPSLGPPSLLTAEQEEKFLPEHIQQVLESHDDTEIQNLINSINAEISEKPRVVLIVTRNSIIFEPLVEALDAGLNENTIISLFSFISLLFINAKTTINELVDSDLCVPLLNFLSSDSQTLVSASFELIVTISENSSYGRDAMLSFGIHTILMDYAKNSTDNSMIESCCLLCK